MGTAWLTVDEGRPCHNPSCKSYGKPHYNCKCYNETQSRSGFSDGGEVSFCSLKKPHQPDCEFFAEGGEVPDRLGERFGNLDELEQNGDDPAQTLGHAAIVHGLGGILNGVIGDSPLANPEKHIKVIDDAKAQYAHRQNGTPEDGLEEQGPERTMGAKIGDKLFENDHGGSADIIQGHPLVGTTGKTNLEPILKRLSKPILENETNPDALRSAVDYFDMSARGSKMLDGELNSLGEEKKAPTHMQESSREASRNDLKEKLQSINENPGQLLNVAGHLGHYLPEHATQLGYMASGAQNYFNALRPKSPQSAPLDGASSPDPLAEDMYNRQLDLANHPMMLFEHMKSGDIQPQDLTTLKTIYPGLYKTIVNKAGEELIKAKSENREIPYKQKMGLSMILGYPLDSTMTQEAMSAIILSSQPHQQSQNKLAHETAQTQKTVDKVTQMYQTPLETRQIDKKS